LSRAASDGKHALGCELGDQAFWQKVKKLGAPQSRLRAHWKRKALWLAQRLRCVAHEQRTSIIKLMMDGLAKVPRRHGS
jgi:hypothetical protein